MTDSATNDDAAKNAEDFKKIEQDATDATKKILSDKIEVTEEDKENAVERELQTLTLDEEKLAEELQTDLQNFISDKVDIDTGQGDIERLPTGIDLLDAILGGGFGLGTFSQIIGNPGTFKSALLAQIIAQAQKKYKGKLLAAYYDSETSMTTDRLAQMGVVNPKIKPYDDKVTIEKIFKTIEAFSAFKQLRNLDFPGIVAWDSIANTSCEKEFTTDDVNSTIGLKARILAGVLPRYVSKLKENRISLIAINQLREKLDMGAYGTPNDLRWMGNRNIPGGQAIKFNAFHILYLKAKSDLKPEQYGFTGLKMEAKCIKNKFEQPNIVVPLVVDFKYGVSNFWSNYNYLADVKRIHAGAWNYLKTMSDKKFRTKDAKDLYDNDEDFRVEFDKQVKEAIENDLLTI